MEPSTSAGTNMGSTGSTSGTNNIASTSNKMGSICTSNMSDSGVSG